MPGPVEVSHLAGVLRGLSAIFWGLPLCLLAFSRHFLAFWPSSYDLLFPAAGAGLVLFGVSRLVSFQPGERVWQQAVLSSQTLSLMLLGLSPFLFLWSRLPGEEFFARAVVVLLVTAMGFMASLTRTLVRLSAMLPDATALADARLFHGLSTYVIAVVGGVAVVLYWRLSPLPLSDFLSLPRQPVGFGRQALLLLLILVPVAVAMAVTWKLKEVVLGMLLAPKA